MSDAFFVDCHSHVVPSGDDGAGMVREGRELCVGAAAAGTAILFATPHVWPHLTLTREREQEIRTAFERVRAALPLELRLGFELTPSDALLRDDLRRYALQGLDAVLMEVPFTGSAERLLALAERAEAQGLTPVIAHPERAEATHLEPGLSFELAGRGWPLQLNATSLLGRHGDTSQEIAWTLVEQGCAALVGSDGHRRTRPPHLDEAYRAVCSRVGEEAARPLFDGTALGLASAPAPSRAARRAVAVTRPRSGGHARG
jgi:protein-tyrosine phosphatase